MYQTRILSGTCLILHQIQKGKPLASRECKFIVKVSRCFRKDPRRRGEGLVTAVPGTALVTCQFTAVVERIQQPEANPLNAFGACVDFTASKKML